MAKLTKISMPAIQSSDAVDYTALNQKFDALVTIINKMIDEVNNSIKYVSDDNDSVEVNLPE